MALCPRAPQAQNIAAGSAMLTAARQASCHISGCADSPSSSRRSSLSKRTLSGSASAVQSGIQQQPLLQRPATGAVETPLLQVCGRALTGLVLAIIASTSGCTSVSAHNVRVEDVDNPTLQAGMPGLCFLSLSAFFTCSTAAHPAKLHGCTAQTYSDLRDVARRDYHKTNQVQ